MYNQLLLPKFVCVCSLIYCLACISVDVLPFYFVFSVLPFDAILAVQFNVYVYYWTPKKKFCKIVTDTRDFSRIQDSLVTRRVRVYINTKQIFTLRFIILLYRILFLLSPSIRFMVIFLSRCCCFCDKSVFFCVSTIHQLAKCSLQKIIVFWWTIFEWTEWESKKDKNIVFWEFLKTKCENYLEDSFLSRTSCT